MNDNSNNASASFQIYLIQEVYSTSLIDNPISNNTLVGATNITKLYKLANITLIIDKTALSSYTDAIE